MGAQYVIKIPIVNEFGESCLGVMHRLSQEGIGVNATAILSFNQAILAAKADATYVSIFAGQVADEGNDPAVTIRNVRRWLDDWALSARMIVGSIRTVMDIQNAALAGNSHRYRPRRSFYQGWWTTGTAGRKYGSLCRTQKKP